MKRCCENDGPLDTQVFTSGFVPKLLWIQMMGVSSSSYVLNALSNLRIACVLGT
jgi:hypothetical protein